jgi:hypothetical protein
MVNIEIHGIRDFNEQQVQDLKKKIFALALKKGDLRLVYVTEVRDHCEDSSGKTELFLRICCNRENQIFSAVRVALKPLNIRMEDLKLENIC